MRPYHEAQEGDQDGSEYHGAVSEQTLTRECADNFGNNAESRQDQNVYFGVTEYPEDMLPEHRVTAVRRLQRNSHRIIGQTSEQQDRP